MPVLIDENDTIVAGHGRILAARKLGITEVPCMIASGWSDAKRRAYTIADNQLALKSEWDLDNLKLELAELGELDFDLDLTGFDLDSLQTPDFEPGTEDDQGKLDEKQMKFIECPHCGVEFEQGQAKTRTQD